MKKKFLVISSLLLLPFFAKSKPQYEIKWGANHAPFDFFLIAANQFKKNVEKKSDHKIKVTLITDVNEREDEHLKKFKSGEYQMSQAYTRQMAEYVPELGLFSIPYLFKNDDHVTKWISSNSSKRLLAKLSNYNIKALGFTYSGGFTQVFGDRLDSFDDYNSKIVSPEDADQFYKEFIQKSMKAKIAEKSDVNEILPIKEGKVNYLEYIVPVTKVINDQKLERDIYLNMTGHRIISRVLFISEEFLKKMPLRLQKIVVEEGVKAAAYERLLTIQNQTKTLAQIKNYKIKFNEWSEDKKQKEKLRFSFLYEDYKRKYGPELINEIENIDNVKMTSLQPNF